MCQFRSSSSSWSIIRCRRSSLTSSTCQTAFHHRIQVSEDGSSRGLCPSRGCLLPASFPLFSFSFSSSWRRKSLSWLWASLSVGWRRAMDCTGISCCFACAIRCVECSECHGIVRQLCVVLRMCRLSPSCRRELWDFFIDWSQNLISFSTLQTAITRQVTHRKLPTSKSKDCQAFSCRWWLVCRFSLLHCSNRCRWLCCSVFSCTWESARWLEVSWRRF